MKNLLNLVFLLLFVFGINTVKTFAQLKGESVLTAGFGVGFLNVAVSLQGAADDNVKTSSAPTLNFMYDYGLIDNFSMGIAVGYNSISIEEKYTSYPTGIDYTKKGTYTRLNIGLRPMFHWGTKEELDWHSGIRLGYSMWDYSFSSNDPFAEPEYDNQDLYSFQILFGARAYFSEKVGMTFDIGVGTPYFVGIGMSVRL